MHVQAAVDLSLSTLESRSPGATVLVAFSGGPDSTALLHALLRSSNNLELDVHAAHLDHDLDGDSSARAEAAVSVARTLGVPISCERRSARALRQPGESLEEAARRIRYDFLRELANSLGAIAIATGHQANDQVETVLLRLLYGSGLAGLGGIPARRGRVIRPLLNVDRRRILDYLDRHGLEAIRDPTNADMRTPRNRIRHLLLPHLASQNPGIEGQLLSLAQAARLATGSLDARLESLLCFSQQGAGIACRRSAFEALPGSLAGHAVGTLCRRAGAAPPSRAAVAEVINQLQTDARLGCDLGGGWRLRGVGERVLLRRPDPPVGPFAYTLRVPGEIHLAEVSLTFRVTRRPAEGWMFRGSRRRAGIALPVAEGDEVVVRNRRPGDRLQPYGCAYRKRLKEVLIDRKIPRRERDKLPLLCVDGQVVWVPGVTIDESVRLREPSDVWLVEIEPTQGSSE